jgi:hypothetical protein
VVLLAVENDGRLRDLERVLAPHFIVRAPAGFTDASALLAAPGLLAVIAELEFCRFNGTRLLDLAAARAPGATQALLVQEGSTAAAALSADRRVLLVGRGARPRGDELGRRVRELLL